MENGQAAVADVRSCCEAGKPLGAACTGPWMLLKAGVANGRTLTFQASLQTDTRDAGGARGDEEVRTDQGLVISRKPDDLPAFCRKIVEEFAEGFDHGPATAAAHAAGDAAATAAVG